MIETFLKTVNYRVTGKDHDYYEYQLDWTNQHKIDEGTSVGLKEASIIFNTITKEILSAVIESNDINVFWSKDPSINFAGIRVSIAEYFDYLTKLTDDRVDVELELDDDIIAKLTAEANSRNISFNDMLEFALIEVIKNS